MKKISIIVPTRQLKRGKNLKHFYRSVSSITDLFDCVKKFKSPEIEFIVVINGLLDKELEQFVRSSKVDKSCINNLNAGVSRAWNMGRQLAEGQFLLFINDDVIFNEESLQKMMEVMDNEPDVAIVGPKGAIWKNGQHVAFVGEAQAEYADAIAGFCFLVRASVFDKIGGFDLNYSSAGMEEIDFCYAVKKQGHKLKVLPNLEIITEPRHGISARKEIIRYLFSEIDTETLDVKNKNYFRKKWGLES